MNGDDFCLHFHKSRGSGALTKDQGSRMNGGEKEGGREHHPRGAAPRRRARTRVESRECRPELAGSLSPHRRPLATTRHSQQKNLKSSSSQRSEISEGET
eukprot:scaffold130839_cov26-Tisochrysis_lutea.AAC.1